MMEASAKQVMDMREVLLALCLKHNGDFESIFEDIKNKAKPDLSILEGNSYNYITLLDSSYPECLKQNYKPPFVIFYEGNIELLSKANKLCVLNDNLASKYATDAIENVCSNVTEKCTFVISFGSKKTNDLIRKLLSKGAAIIAVLDHGIGVDNYDDKELYNTLAKEQLVISSYPKTVNKKNSNTQVDCAKLQATLSSSILVGGVSKKSPQACAIAFALQGNVKVFCIPFEMGSSYINNSLIHDGAILLEDYEQLLYEGDY